MKKFQFNVKDFDAGGRIGQILLNNKEIVTPNLFPVVDPFKNLISPNDLYHKFNAQALFTNAYIIYNNNKKNAPIIEKGLHKHLDFPGLIATDSGGFQDYMYGGGISIKPDEIEPFQEQIGSDFPVILDIPVQTTDNYEIAENKVNTTIQRAKENIERRSRENTAWFGPIHGSVHPELVKKSAIEMSKLDFGIYPIGGVVKTFIDYRFELSISILLQAKKYLRPDRPVHMFGLGLPTFFSLAVLCGADTFDSAAYILYAEDGRYFTLSGTRKLEELFEFPCHCPICTKYTPKEIQSLPKNEQTRLLASHNLYLSFSELRTIRQAIKEGRLWELCEQRVQAHPYLIKGMKIIKKYPEYFESMLNLNKQKGQYYLTSLSFFNPAFANFRKRVVDFVIPKDKNALVILPELDLPSTNGKSMEKWLSILSKKEKLSQIQISIMSNLLGLIPIELSETYPAAQHVSQGSMIENPSQKKTLLKSIKKLIENNRTKIKNVHILIPESFIDEFNVEKKFIKEEHICFYLKEFLNENFTSILVENIDNLDKSL